MLQDPFILLVLFGVVLYCNLALIAILLYKHLTRPAQSKSPTSSPLAPKSTAPRLTDDPKLLAFMARGDPNFKREFPSLAGQPPHAGTPQPAMDAGTPAAPMVIRERAQPQLIRDEGVPQPASVRPDPAVIGGPPVPTLETPARPSPQAARVDTDADLEALGALWMRLAPRDRHELLQLARLKLRLPTD